MSETVESIESQKQNLQENIAKLITEFSISTGMIVRGSYIYHHPSQAALPSYKVGLEICPPSPYLLPSGITIESLSGIGFEPVPYQGYGAIRFKCGNISLMFDKTEAIVMWSDSGKFWNGKLRDSEHLKELMTSRNAPD